MSTSIILRDKGVDDIERCFDDAAHSIGLSYCTGAIFPKGRRYGLLYTQHQTDNGMTYRSFSAVIDTSQDGGKIEVSINDLPSVTCLTRGRQLSEDEKTAFVGYLK